MKLILRIAVNIGNYDLLMGHYGGASPYPHCFPDVIDNKLAAQKVVETACNMLVTAAEALNVGYVMPFAGQYVFGGKLANPNSDRATLPLDKAVEFIMSLIVCEVISMNHGGYFDLSEKIKSSDYIEPDLEVLEKYFSELSTAKFPYEETTEPIWENFEEDQLRSARKVLEKSRTGNIALQNSFVIGEGARWVTINLDPHHQETPVEIGKQPKFKNVTEISMPSTLLMRLSTRKTGYKGCTTLHWNLSGVGSPLVWRRSESFDLASYSLLNFYGV